MASQPVCAVCAAVDVDRCVRCQAVYYCSKRCQKMHWRSSHRRRCIPAAERAAFNTPANATRLGRAVRRGDEALAAELTLRGADVNFRDPRTNATCLYVAAMNGHLSLIHI